MYSNKWRKKEKNYLVIYERDLRIRMLCTLFSKNEANEPICMGPQKPYKSMSTHIQIYSAWYTNVSCSLGILALVCTCRRMSKLLKKCISWSWYVFSVLYNYQLNIQLKVCNFSFFSLLMEKKIYGVKMHKWKLWYFSN